MSNLKIVPIWCFNFGNLVVRPKWCRKNAIIIFDVNAMLICGSQTFNLSKMKTEFAVAERVDPQSLWRCTPIQTINERNDA